MSVIAELVAAIVAEPDDLALREVYADALDEPRGELAWLQCRIARLGVIADTDAVRAAERAAYARAEVVYRNELHGARVAIWCGFVERLEVAVPELERLVEEGVFARHPIRTLAIATPTQALLDRANALLERAGAIPERVEISVGNGTRPAQLDFTDAPLLARRAVRFANVDSRWTAIARARASKLDFDACTVGEEALAALASCDLEALAIRARRSYTEPERHAALWDAIGRMRRLAEVSISPAFPDEADAIVPALFAHATLSRFASNGFERPSFTRLVVTQPKARSLVEIGRLEAGAIPSVIERLPSLETIAARVGVEEQLSDRTIDAIASTLARSKVRYVECAGADPRLRARCRDVVFGVRAHGVWITG